MDLESDSVKMVLSQKGCIVYLMSASNPEIAPVLRSVRAELIPQVPHLAPYLEKYTDVFQTSIHRALVERDTDPDLVSGADRNKLERHIMAGFMVRVLCSDMVEGSGVEAHLRQFDSTRRMLMFGEGSLRAFGRDIKTTQHNAADRVEAAFTAGNDAEHQWWPLALHRYSELGKVAKHDAGTTWVITGPLFLPSRIRQVPNEGLSLSGAIRSPALISTTVRYLQFIQKANIQAEDKAAAAHDLTPALLALAGLHIVDFFASVLSDPYVFRGTIIKTDSGKFKLTEGQSKLQKRYRFKRIKADKLPNATLQCPARAEYDTGASSLNDLIHAVINEAAIRRLV